MNYWNEPYPESIDDLIGKANENFSFLHQKLNDSNCKTLEELYVANKSGKTERQKLAFEELGYLPNINNEIKGLYLFGECKDETVVPIYIGISRGIFRRLKQHGWGKLDNEATLAYLMASNKSNYVGKRKDFSYETLCEEQKIIRQFKVAILPELNDYDLYFMEVYFAGKLKTHWNTFKTH
jgi:hypothetical protein